MLERPDSDVPGLFLDKYIPARNCWDALSVSSASFFKAAVSGHSLRLHSGSPLSGGSQKAARLTVSESEGCAFMKASSRPVLSQCGCGAGLPRCRAIYFTRSSTGNLWESGTMSLKAWVQISLDSSWRRFFREFDLAVAHVTPESSHAANAVVKASASPSRTAFTSGSGKAPAGVLKSAAQAAIRAVWLESLLQPKHWTIRGGKRGRHHPARELWPL